MYTLMAGATYKVQFCFLPKCLISQPSTHTGTEPPTFQPFWLIDNPLYLLNHMPWCHNYIYFPAKNMSDTSVSHQLPRLWRHTILPKNMSHFKMTYLVQVHLIHNCTALEDTHEIWREGPWKNIQKRSIIIFHVHVLLRIRLGEEQRHSKNGKKRITIKNANIHWN